MTIPPSPEAWLRQQARTVKGSMLAAILAAFGGGLLIILQARLLALVCQRVVIEGIGLAPLLPLLAWVGAVALLRGLAAYLSEHAAIKAAAQVRQQVRTALYQRLLLLRPTGLSGEVGPLTEAVTAGIEGLEAYIARFLPQMVLAGLLPLAVLLVVLPSEWRSSLVLIFSAPFIPLLMVLIGKGTETLNRRQFSRLSRMAGHLLDLVQGLPDLKIFGAAKREAELVALVSDQYRTGTMAVLRVAFLSAFTLEFFSTVGTAVVAVIIGFRLLAGNLSLLDGLFVLLLAPEYYLPLRNLGLAYHSRMNGMAAAERIIPLLQQPLPDAAGGQLVVPFRAPEISCDSVSFRYGGQRGGVQEVSLTIPANSITALAGASGSGKSTLARLLLGLARPESGQILVNSVDLAQLDQAAWRSQLAWVPQQPFFFSATIRENLLLGRPNADQQAIQQALAAAALTDVIKALPEGLATRLGDRGAGLSGGELRRLALARVFLRDAGLVVLDEPTAGLDTENEQLVLNAVEQLAAGRTVLIISHREATISRCQQIVVLAAGRLEQVTTSQEYLEVTP
ncbi:ABC transporter, CydDC cysteine exporter (CydDC-E) family, permease/ATP-binding protein CydD [Trichlorobacter lovleyi SZ]|uniref:ABC transporter, CydDC cysteine exporter (CydDC-E) family, permease/ATP-binding protein CydD n=2 Tax=Trichlorobacter lovleyi TaxID=313985 RepID=B3E2U8_TRIL1|nr:ABC transporter, CydDC cysteine exporter (CydDC-E) family, permease/ATP-binding protein CydD [Trichlorobacter lovleyi SZ]